MILIAASGFIYAPRSSKNLGDRAQLACTVERLRSAFPESRLVAIANSLNDEVDLSDLEVSYKAIRYLTSPIKVPLLGVPIPPDSARVLRVLAFLASCQRMANGKDPRLLSPIGRVALRELDESTALVLSGAGTFNDLYIKSVGGFWGVLARCMSLLGKPVVASGQQVGPLRRASRRALARWALHPIDLLGVRDPSSKVAAEAAGVSAARTVLTGDDAWDLTPASSGAAQSALKRQHVAEPFIAVQMRFGGSVGWDEADCESFAAALSQLSSGIELPLVFVACMTGRGLDDRYAAARVREHLDVTSWTLEEELDAPTTKAILGRAALGVGIANHFCVFAASMGTPVIGLHATPYMEQKIKGIAELWPNRVIALPKATGLRPSVLLSRARELLQKQIEGTDTARPSIELQPDEPIRFLAERLTESPAQTYSARFTQSHSVEAYEQEFQTGRLMRNMSNLEFNTMRSVLEPYRRAPFKRHLDFACGSGRAIAFVQPFAERTVGVDVSEAMLNRARERFPTTQFVCGDVSADPDLLEPLGPFDLVTVWRFLAPADPSLRASAISAIARSVEDGGLVIVNNNANRTSLHRVALSLRAVVKRQPLRSSGPYKGSLPHRKLRRLLEDAGLNVEKTQAVCYLPEQLASRLPAWLWMPLERALARLNVAPQYSVNQLVIARRSEQSDAPGAVARSEAR